MPGLINKVKDKLSDSASSSRRSSKSDSPSGLSTKSGSPNGRVIPPEPVQQNPDGGLSSDHEAEAPLQAHNLARVNKRCTMLEWDTRLAKEAESYAERLASIGRLEHSGIEAQGENLFTSSNDVRYEDAVSRWLDEEKKYNGEKVGEGTFEDWENFCKH